MKEICLKISRCKNVHDASNIDIGLNIFADLLNGKVYTTIFVRNDATSSVFDIEVALNNIKMSYFCISEG